MSTCNLQARIAEVKCLVGKDVATGKALS